MAEPRILEKFRAAKAEEIAALLEQERRGELPELYSGERPSFTSALRDAARKPGGPGVALIAEYKRASPSKGDIAPELTPEDVGRAYAENGAAAISVLTEATYFKGDLAYLEAMAAFGLPLLRKDFLLHPLQVVASAATPAAAVLLIARYFVEQPETFKALHEVAHGLGLEVVTEIFAEAELELSRAAGATIIQVNNRDLDTLSLDVDRCLTTVKRRAASEVWIAASGVTTGADLARVRDAGYDAALVGTRLMAGGAPGKALAELLAPLY